MIFETASGKSYSFCFLSHFFLKLIIFLPETKFVSFRCLVNIKLRQEQLVNCKIYENKNGLIFDEVSIKRDLIVHILCMNFGEQFILFLPFRTAPESCGAEPPLGVGRLAFLLPWGSFSP